MAHPPEPAIVRAESQQLLQGVAIHFLDRVYYYSVKICNL
jgi:hypothetical protein